MTAGAGRRGGAVLGSPIAHSLSPVLHQAAYDALGLADWTYRAIECDESSLADTLGGLDHEGLAGASLTMPLKRAVMPLLAEVDAVAVGVAAANTVIFGAGSHRWRGANTDVAGMTAALRDAGVSLRVADVPWVLGGGATAGSALAALAELGAGRAVTAVRRPDATAELKATAARVGVALDVRPWSQAAGCGDACLVISTTPAGATDALAGELGGVRGTLFDVGYADWPTPLAAAWLDSGGAVIGGVELLIEQAAEQVRLMTGQEPPIAAMRAALNSATTG